MNTIEHKAKEYTENRDVYDKGIREMSDLKQSLAEYKSKCAQQQAELQQLKSKYDEMHEIWYETEKVIPPNSLSFDKCIFRTIIVYFRLLKNKSRVLN